MKKVIISFIILFLSGILFTFTSCKEEKSIKIRQMPGTFQEIDFSLDDIAEDLEFVLFSTEVSLPYSQVVKWYDPYFYYPVRTFNKAEIHRFTSDGKYVDKLSKNGRGPDEYLGIVDYFVDEKTGNLYVITNFTDFMTSQILYFK